MFCGWDWGSTVHALCLIDDQGALVKSWMAQHTEDQLVKVFRELAQLVGGDVATRRLTFTLTTDCLKP